MPRVRPLTAKQAEAESKQKADEAFRDVLALYKSRTGRTDMEVAARIGCSRVKVSRMRCGPSAATLEQVRAAMHSLGASKEDWLRLGGY